ncbi:MAG: flippase-like domain-containing protein [Candidatus Zixiibacteriota bacterium]|nr:MAG: flippase-like domain-containing protein [candidate division Zixibacteria bacterium]
MTVRVRKLIYVIVGISVSGVLIWMLFRNIDMQKLILALKEADYLWLVPNILIIMLTMYQRAFRWRFMIAPIKHVEFSNLIAATCIGFMANNVLPLRLGEFARAYSLSSQDRGVTKSASLATIFVERMVFDLVALLLIFGAVVSYSASLRSHLEENMIAATKLAIAIALVGLLSMLLLALRPNQVGNVLTRYLFFLPDRANEFIKNVIVKFSHGLIFLTDMKAVINVGLQTLLIWILMGLSNYFVFKAFGFDIPLDASFVLLVVVSVLILAPSTPGFLGVYHYGVVLSLSVYGITDERALSCALVLHAAQYIVVTLMGFYFLRKEHLSLKDLEESAAEED